MKDQNLTVKSFSVLIAQKFVNMKIQIVGEGVRISQCHIDFS
jgi:hypothetical protein